MKVAVSADHAGFQLKQKVTEHLQKCLYDMVDLGTHNEDPVDYPDFAESVGRAVLAGKVERGIVICGSGVGACVAANKIRGIRAGLCHDHYSAHQGVEHDDMNVLVLGARVIGVEMAYELATAFLNSKFTGEERHKKRLAKVKALEDAWRKESQ